MMTEIDNILDQKAGETDIDVVEHFQKTLEAVLRPKYTTH